MYSRQLYRPAPSSFIVGLFATPSEDFGNIMAQIQGLAAHAAGAELLPYRYDPGELGTQEVEIAITHCGICHSDLHLISNDWGISQYPFIPGHEIVGTVAAIGDGVRSFAVGQRVGLGWQSNSCGECEWCTRGMEHLCPAAEATCVHRNGAHNLMARYERILADTPVVRNQVKIAVADAAVGNGDLHLL